MKSPHSGQAGFVWLPVLLVILAILAASGGAYWWGHKAPAVQTQQPQEQAQTQTSTQAQIKFLPSPFSGAAPFYLYFNTPGDSKYTLYYIDFGDGTKGNMYQSEVDCSDKWCASHTYQKPGVYTAKLYGGATVQDKGTPGTINGTSVLLSTVTVTATNSQSVSVPGTGEMPAEKSCSDTGTCWVTINAAGTETDVSVRVPPEYKKAIALSVQPGTPADEKLFAYIKSVSTQNTGVWLQYHYGDAGCSATKYYHDWSSTSAKQTVIVWVSFCEGENVTPPSENLMLQILGTLVKG